MGNTKQKFKVRVQHGTLGEKSEQHAKCFATQSPTQFPLQTPNVKASHAPSSAWQGNPISASKTFKQQTAPGVLQKELQI